MGGVCLHMRIRIDLGSRCPTGQHLAAVPVRATAQICLSGARMRRPPEKLHTRRSADSARQSVSARTTVRARLDSSASRLSPIPRARQICGDADLECQRRPGIIGSVLARAAAAGRAVEVPAVRPGRRTCLLAVGQNLRADGRPRGSRRTA